MRLEQHVRGVPFVALPHGVHSSEAQGLFRVMADCAPVLLWMAGRDAECHFFNQSWLQFTGRSMEAEIGVGWAEGVHHEDLQRVLDHYMKSFHVRQSFEMEYRLRRHDGQYRWILDRGVPHFSPDGTFEGYIGSCVDITEQRESMDSLKQVLHNLTIANQELERFSYVASHDLKEPIRSVVNYSELLLEELGDTLPEEARLWIGRMAKEGVRMRGMIDDWLDFSRIGKGAEKFGMVDLGPVLRDVLEGLQLSISESRALIQIDSLPRVHANRIMLTTIFQNLIGNALKYHRSHESPVISVSAKRRGQEWVFCIADNGIGFEMSQKDEIFQIFRRLHKKNNYGGSGLGLSICKKIIEMHQGRIWAESVVGKGSQFYFSLPIRMIGDKEAV